MNKAEIRERIIQYIWISIGIIILNIGFYFFLDPIRLVMGGMMGLATVLHPIFNLIGPWFTPSVFLYIVNIICLILGMLLLGKDFFIKTIYASLFTPTILLILEKTCDPLYFINQFSETGKILMPIICGAVLSAVGIGIPIRNNGSTGGMDVIQKIMHKKLRINYSVAMYLTDGVIIVLSGLRFINGFSYDLEMVIYGILAIWGTAVLTDMIVLNAKTRRTVFIITEKPIEIRDMIYKKTSRGVTFSDASGAYSGKDKTLVICTMDTRQSRKVSEYINHIDPEAFHS
jgi:uncharacterized membrane-anchored protein YitT (DUF2179 family)